MNSGDYLQSDGSKEQRFRIEDLVASGRSFQIVRCVDTERDESVYAKAPRYERDAEDRDKLREQWREALEFETEVLKRQIEGLPTFVELLEVAVEAPEKASEPVLVYEPFVGDTLYDFVAKRPAGTISIGSLLEKIRAVGEVCRELHDEGLLYRDLDPRHVIVTEEGEFAGMVGTGNIALIGEAPNSITSRLADAPYAAPEVRNVRSGETLRPAADVYGLCAMASYAFTGQEPTTAVESPLTGEAYEALDSVMVDGLDHLVAMGLQPVAKHRVEMETLVEYATDSGLADLTTPESRQKLDIQPLPEPWSGAEPPGANRATRSNLSSGPLISVPGEGSTDSDPEGSPGGDVEGVKSAPVKEFLGESDDEEAAGDADSDGRSDEAGAPVREISMVDENLEGEQGADETADEGETMIDWEKRAKESPLPPFAELPLRWKLAMSIGLPVLGIVVAVVLGFLGVY